MSICIFCITFLIAKALLQINKTFFRKRILLLSSTSSKSSGLGPSVLNTSLICSFNENFWLDKQIRFLTFVFRSTHFNSRKARNFKLDVIGEMGKEEVGAGNGVLRDVISQFWKLLVLAATVGAAGKVPRIRQDFQKNEWETVRRVFVYKFVCLGYLPLQLSPALMTTCLFGHEAFSDALLLDSFRFYVSSEE